MNRNVKAIVVTCLMAAPVLAAAQTQQQTGPGMNPAQGTPTNPQSGSQGTATQGQPSTTPSPSAPRQDGNVQGQPQPGQIPNQGQAPSGQTGQGTQGQAAPAAPGTAEKKVVTPEEVGISFAPPQGWNQGDPKAFTVPGDVCCAWSPDNVASIVVFVQNTGQPYSPRVLLEQSAQALEKGLGAEVKQKEVRDIGGMRAFSLVITGNGNGAAIDGKGTVRTTQHWIAIPRDKDVIIFLMNSPEAGFDKNEQALQSILGSLKVTGQQSPEQKAAT